MVTRLFVPAILASLASLSASTSVRAETITVCADGCDFTSINAAIDAAVEGDVIQLSAETYYEGAVIDLDGKGVHLLGATNGCGGPASVLDGERQHRVLNCITGETAATMFSNLVIQNGNVSSDSGGGVKIDGASPVFENCVFSRNQVGNCCSGGGADIRNSSSPVFRQCVFTENRAASSAALSSNHQSSTTLENCIVVRNQATSGPGSGLGFWNGGSSLVSGCIISGNSGASGWGSDAIRTGGATLTITSTVVCGDAISGGYTDGGGNCIGSCDTCAPTYGDYDCDGVTDDVDLCSIDDAADSDGDGTVDCLDQCPDDPEKTTPGQCGCGIPDTDTDEDGTADCNDACPDDPLKTQPGICGCGIADLDTDKDGTLDCNDECPDDPLKTTPGVCGCGYVDVAGDTETDSDSDGTPDCFDLCPQDPAKIDPGICGCGVADIDSDSDGYEDCNDAFPDDPDEWADSDQDGVPDGQDSEYLVPLGSSVQEAIDTVGGVAVIQLQPGTYSEGATLVIGAPNVVVRGAIDAEGNPMTVLDGGGEHQVIRAFAPSAYEETLGLENLIIRNGRTFSDDYPDNLAAGVLSIYYELNMSNCIVEQNRAAGNGVGGVYMMSSRYWVSDSPFGLNNCIIRDNVSDGETGIGGAYIRANHASHPGPIRLDVIDCQITGNIGGFVGGALLTGPPSDFDGLVDRCLIKDNVGGGLLASDSINLRDTAVYCNTPFAILAFDGYEDLGGNCVSDDDCEACLDSDGDGVFDINDDFPDDPDETTDSDGDGVGDNADGCPDDSDKIAPGDCGCGIPDTDTDDDGIADCNDACPNDPENDADSDGICGDVDTCPYDAENDADADGICGDVDTCPYDADNDADGDGVCGDVDNCELANTNQADCNGNGIGDTCDIADGLVIDCDGNGVPDACDLQDAVNDCNGNGFVDACEIANGLAADCDDDGVIDSCQIAGDGSLDCDTNGRLDVCDLADGGADCNSNGVLDGCDIGGGGSADADGNGIPDECLADAVYNQTDGSYWNTLSGAMANAVAGDTLLVPEAFFADLTGLELTLDGLTLRSLGGVTLDAMPDGILLGGDTTLAAAQAESIEIGSALDLLAGEAATLSGAPVGFGETAVVSIPAGGQLSVASSEALVNDGAISILDGLLIAESGTTQSSTGSLSGFGTVAGSLVNDGTVTAVADLQFTDDLTNNGEFRIQSGTLTTIGTFTNNGLVLGDPSGGFTGGSAPAMTVIGDLVVGESGSLLFGQSAGTLRVSGDVSIAATESVRIDLSSTELRMVGLGESGDGVQELELIGEDLGANEDGYERPLGGFPIGTLRIGPMPTTVRLVDAIDNDGLGDGSCETLYVDRLQLDANTTLETNGCTIHCRELVLDPSATIDVPGNVVIVTEPAPCPADLDGDGDVGPQDLALLLGAWNTTDAAADLDGDGTVGAQDLAILLGAWSACPE